MMKASVEGRLIGVRWTVGDVSAHGFAALRLSIWAAYNLFGPAARYAVCVNTISTREAKSRTGAVPQEVEWRAAGALPQCLREVLDDGMAQGVAWKLAPLRLFEDRYEIALDNDCILWELPEAMRDWLAEETPRCLIAADVSLALGAFTALTRPEPRNTGIRGLPPGYDLEAALQETLSRHKVPLTSELDEQGLQVVAMDLPWPAHVVTTDEVSICSPFWPHQTELGRCGAHFVGLNMRDLPFDYYGRPGTDWMIEHWGRHLGELRRKAGIPAM